MEPVTGDLTTEVYESVLEGRDVLYIVDTHLLDHACAHLEIGRNNALIVLPGADLASAASAGALDSSCTKLGSAWSVAATLPMITYTGTVWCASGEDGQPALGDPNTRQVAFGPIIDELQCNNIHKIVQDSVAAGSWPRAAALSGSSANQRCLLTWMLKTRRLRRKLLARWNRLPGSRTWTNPPSRSTRVNTHPSSASWAARDGHALQTGCIRARSTSASSRFPGQGSGLGNAAAFWWRGGPYRGVPETHRLAMCLAIAGYPFQVSPPRRENTTVEN